MWGKGPIPEELSAYPGYLLARLGEASRRRFSEALAPVELHPRHFGVLTVVAAHPGLTQQQLHEKTAIDASSMVAVLDELEARGLAERRPYPGDRRARTIFLTPLGEQTLERVRTLTRELQGQLLAPLSADERRTLIALLRKLAGASLES
ncbi:MAG TPA: MarR family transcriptional regulator [Solirubrobacteraceae bacterium]|jgi:DNA-binding MarR family transcriptional regulator|nr:MarR family transcriptional regulator [Solirubrobacteraceae bacterium]